jgi:hypothetical protein
MALELEIPEALATALRGLVGSQSPLGRRKGIAPSAETFAQCAVFRGIASASSHGVPAGAAP